MRLRQADISAVEQIAFTNLALVKASERSDRRDRLRPQCRVELCRNAPARLQSLRDQVRLDRAGAIAIEGHTRKRQQGIRCRCGNPACRRCDLGAAIVLCLAPVADDRQLHIVREVECQRAAHAIALVSVDIVVGNGTDVADIAVIFAVKTREAKPALVADRQVDYPARPIFLAIEIGDFRRPFKLVGWRLGHDIDDACACVLAEQRALRPAQDFDPLDVDQIAECFTGATVDDAINDC